MGTRSECLDTALAGARRVLPAMETLETRLLLSGTAYLVDSLADTVAADGVVTLREAIEAANTNTAVTADVPAGNDAETDTITFDQAALSADAGVALGEPLRITLDGKALEITGDLCLEGLGSDVLTVDADGRSRAFAIADPGINIEMSGLVVAGGAADLGGGILNHGALALTNVIVSDNRAADSGGGLLNRGRLALTASVVTGNAVSSEYWGWGGGICNWGTLIVADSEVSDNAVVHQGGGIYNRGALTLLDSTVAGNRAVGRQPRGDGAYGGGLFNDSGTATVVGSIITGNSSAASGAGFVDFGGSSTLTNSVVSANHAADGGGGIAVFGGSVTVTNSTVAGNSADEGGGVVAHYGSTVLNNTLVAFNGRGAGPDVSGPVTSHNSLLGIDPGFVRAPSAGPDGLWGTDDDDAGDLHLHSMSLAVSLGDTDLAVDENGTPLAKDIDGRPRVADGRVDIGAYEWQGGRAAFLDTPSPLITTREDVADFADGKISLREACLYGSLLGETVTVAPGLGFPLVSLERGPLRFYQDVSIDATSVGGMIIDAAGQGPAMKVEGKATVCLTGLTLTGGSDAGLYNRFGDVTLIDSTVAGNRGGGIRNHEGTLSVLSSTVMHNTGAHSGGGIYSGDGELRILDSIISHNTAQEGGGFANSHGNATVINSRISANQAAGSGGICNQDHGTVLLVDSIVSDNEAAEYFGGGISNWQGCSFVMIGSTVSGNRSRDGGGGIWHPHGEMTLQNCQVLHNVVWSLDADMGAGGGILTASASLTLVNTAVSANSSPGHGGGICRLDTSSGNITLTHSTISGNWAGSGGGGIYNGGEAIVLNNTLVALNQAPDAAEIRGPVQNNSSLIGVDPGFVRDPSPGPDATWGTADDDGGDLRLRPGSVVIDAGDPALAVDADGKPLMQDLAGNARLVNAAVDIGAYEFEHRFGDANDDGDVDLVDFALFKKHFGTSDADWAKGDFDGNGAVNLDDFAILKQNFSPTAAPGGTLAVAVACEDGGEEHLTARPMDERVRQGVTRRARRRSGIPARHRTPAVLNQTLVEAIAKGHHWQQQLESG